MNDAAIEFKVNDLVMLRLPNDLNEVGRKRHYNTWFRVMFIDNDDTFIGKLERWDLFDFTLYQKDECVKLDVTKVLQKYKDGDQFCYGDQITICECEGLCRNK